MRGERENANQREALAQYIATSVYFFVNLIFHCSLFIAMDVIWIFNLECAFKR